MDRSSGIYQHWLAGELERARLLGYQSFSGVWKAIMRNPYAEGSPCREEWVIGRHDAQFNRPAIQVKDTPFPKPRIYRTDERDVA